MQAILSNAQHPEYGVVTIPFPIQNEEYSHALELLEALEIGDIINRDCKVEEIQEGLPILKRLEKVAVNIDELDYSGEVMERRLHHSRPSPGKMLPRWYRRPC